PDRVRVVDLPVVSLGIRATEVRLVRWPVRNELLVAGQVDAIGRAPIDRFQRDKALLLAEPQHTAPAHQGKWRAQLYRVDEQVIHRADLLTRSVVGSAPR